MVLNLPRVSPYVACRDLRGMRWFDEDEGMRNWVIVLYHRMFYGYCSQQIVIVYGLSFVHACNTIVQHDRNSDITCTEFILARYCIGSKGAALTAALCETRLLFE